MEGLAQMPLEITQIAMGLTFIAIWAFAGNILLVRRSKASPSKFANPARPSLSKGN